MGVATGCGCKEVYIDFLILLIPTPLVSEKLIQMDVVMEIVNGHNVFTTTLRDNNYYGKLGEEVYSSF